MATILIVEDRPIERKYLATLLRTGGHDVVESADGQDALRRAQAAPPDLVISDILMPIVDGYEMVRRMREIPALLATPVIFYTATYHEREARVLAGQTGVAAVLTKPCAPQLLLETVAAVLQSPSAWPSPAAGADEDLSIVKSALASRVEELEASQQRLAAIVDMAHQISAERSPSAMLARVCAAARDVTLAEHAAIAMLASDGTRFQWVVTRGVDDAALRRWTPPVDGPLVEPVIRERRSVRLKNDDGRPGWLGFPETHTPVLSCLVVPVASPSRVFGCLVLRNKLGAREFSERDQQVATAVAIQAGIAYENTSLYERIERHAEILEAEVAERRRVEVELRHSNERTAFALAAARMGTWEMDLATQRVIWSDAMAEVFGVAAEDKPQTADAFASLIHPDDRQTLEVAMEHTMREGRDLQVEFRAQRPDGGTRALYAHARLVRNPDGTPQGLLGVGMDISDRKLLEAQLRQAQKMEAIGQLAGGVAHDFNNLLTAIHGYAELLADTLEPGDERRSDVDEILNASNRAASLTRQLLTFSRKQVLQPTLVDVNRLLADISKMLGRVIGEDIQLILAATATPALVLADPSQIEQIIMNLVVNARDAMPRGGRLNIETSHVTLDDSYALAHAAVRPGRYVMFAVTDNGTGMDEATRQRIFEPFFTTKERTHGTGLGLATVYGIVTQSGGYIWVYSEPGQGTTFKVYLPDADGVETAKPHVAESVAPAAGHETVLLVEDEDAVRQLSRLLLERAGYRVLVTANPEEAEKMFRDQAGAIDLLLTDVVMPGSSGPDLYRRLAAEQPGLRVVYMSGYPDQAIAPHAELGPDVVFVQKPFTASGLMHKVREALDR